MLLDELWILRRAGQATSAEAKSLFIQLMRAWDSYAKVVEPGHDLKEEIEQIKSVMPWMQISGGAGSLDPLKDASNRQAEEIRNWSPKPASGSLTPYGGDPGGVITPVGGGRPDVDY
jgi:hypothetical protein